MSTRKTLTAAKMWQVVGGLFLIFTGFAAFLWLAGADFSSEYRRTALFSTSSLFGAEPRGTRLSACGIAQSLLPESVGSAVPCAWWNIGAFYILPSIALIYAVKRSLSRT